MNKPMWNLDFQSYNPPLAYRVRKQDEEGGGLFFMLIALVIGLIISACI